MIKRIDIFENLNIDCSLININNPGDVLYLDIETTGLTARNSSIYMIGLVWLENNKWTFTGLFAESPANEKEVIDEFLTICKGFTTLIHFNGNRFDLPFISYRADVYNLKFDAESFINIDLYKEISSFRHLLGIGNCKQKTIESFLGINREDKYDGGKLIAVYNEYVADKSDELFELLYQHNHDDLLGMLEITPVFVYKKLADTHPTLKSYDEHEFTDYKGNCCVEILLEYSLSLLLPSPVSINRDGVFLSIKRDKAYLRIPIIYAELKHFFPNYREYFYLPKEDTALHKSVASYVDKDYRQKATKENCYVRKSGSFIPHYLDDRIPAFKKNAASDELYMEFNDSFINNALLTEEYFSNFLCNAYRKR